MTEALQERPSAYDELVAEMKQRQQEKDQQARADAVVVAYVHSNEVSYSWHHSIVELLGNDAQNKQRVWRAGYIAMSHGTDGMADARNRAVAEFLREGKADWLFWIDTDMGFPDDVIEQLMAAADPVERPIVGALAFTWRQGEPDGMGGWDCLATPTTFDWGHTDDGAMGFTVRFNYVFDKVQQVAGTGSACVLIHKSVFEAIFEEFKPKGQMWYDRVPNSGMGRVVSEDLSFCLRANAVGKTVWVDTGVKTTHMKTIWVGESTYLRQRVLDDLMAQQKVPVATEATAVIVPTLRRPYNAEPFMESLRASDTPLAKVYAIIDESDKESAQAWIDQGANVIWFDDTRPTDWADEDGLTPGTFAERCNLGYQATDEPWLFIVGDDVKFRSHWLDHAQHLARDGAHVIGTNDLENPRVMAGQHATHMLIRRSYIDERGASWDGPKVMCHEGYRHWYVDDELVTVAKQRGVWAFAFDSEVEQFHPLFDRADDDETYRRIKYSIQSDKERFEARFQEYSQ